MDPTLFFRLRMISSSRRPRTRLWTDRAPFKRKVGGWLGGGGCEGLPACGATVQKAWLVGQDPVPGTDMGEGKGLGMVHERSAWYASDHRGVVVEFRRG